MSNKKIVLSFICKNEEDVVLDMIKSCLSIIDSIVVLDTGSYDKTKEVIEKFCILENIPYVIKEEEFINYSQARNSLKYYTTEFIKSHYIGQNLNDIYWLTIDCDDLLVIGNDFDINLLIDDVYDIAIRTGNIIYRKPSIVKSTDLGSWVGILHETYVSNNISYFDYLNINVRHIGSTWNDNNKYHRQALKLENEIANGLMNIRTYFYLAEAYLFANMKDRAFYYFKYITDNYENNDFNREYIAYSYYQISFLSDKKVEYLLLSYEIDNRRAESIFSLISYYVEYGLNNVAYIYSKMLVEKFNGKSAFPECGLYIEEGIYYIQIYLTHIGICDMLNIKDDAYNISKSILLTKNINI